MAPIAIIVTLNIKISNDMYYTYTY